MTVWYNDNEPFIGQWLGELVKAGELPEGDLEDRSIAEIMPNDLSPYTQCHFFAGIGGWPYALQLAGWGRDRPVWTASCPCQPFSAAGKRQGTADKRHLWPELRRLIAECRPATIFGEQVASKDGRLWLAGVRADLEALGYAFGSADLCAAGVGAPNIRQRLFWMAESGSERRQRREGAAQGRQFDRENAGRLQGDDGSISVGEDRGRMADANGGLAGDGRLQPGRQHGQQPQDGSAGERLAHADAHGRQDGGIGTDRLAALARLERNSSERPRRTPWSSAVYIPCADGKARRIEPSIQPLAHGVPNRVGTLRGAGNAINPILAAEFIKAYLDLDTA